MHGCAEERVYKNLFMSHDINKHTYAPILQQMSNLNDYIIKGMLIKYILSNLNDYVIKGMLIKYILSNLNN